MPASTEQPKSRAGWMNFQPAARPAPVDGALLLPRAAGEVIDAGGIEGTVKVDPRWHPDAPLGITEDIEPGRMIAAHTHAGTAQWSLNLGAADDDEDDGDPLLVFIVGRKEYEIRKGESIWRDPGVPHALLNPGDRPVRQLEFNIGGDMSAYFRRRRELVLAGADPEKIVAMAGEYGLIFHPDLTANIEAYYGVSASGPWR